MKVPLASPCKGNGEGVLCKVFQQDTHGKVQGD